MKNSELCKDSLLKSKDFDFINDKNSLKVPEVSIDVKVWKKQN